jgi:hypothetical protein
MKTLNNTNLDDVKKNVTDVEIIGNVDMFQLLCKASSKKEGWMKSTKACEIPGVGCIVQITTQQWGMVTEAVTFAPGSCIVDDINEGKKLVNFSL